MSPSNFQHFEFIRRIPGIAKLTGGGPFQPDVAKNKADRAGHRDYLSTQIQGFSQRAERIRTERTERHLPSVGPGVPFLLRVPHGDDGIFKFLGDRLGLEVVAEYEDGFLIVSAEDLDLQYVSDLADEFLEVKRGSGQVASILEFDDDPHSQSRISRILDEELLEAWPFQNDSEYILDVSIEVASFSPPRPLRKSKNPVKQAQQDADYESRIADFFSLWDEKRRTRETEVENFVEHYGGEILHIVDDSHIQRFPDSFSTRIKMKGDGCRDFIHNFPHLFEVTKPDDIIQPTISAAFQDSDDYDFQLIAPPAEAPSICIIDSGIQENHKWLSAAVLTSRSFCFLPQVSSNDTADYVQGGGHGTRVAGACLYPAEVPTGGAHQADFWLTNARVLDANNELPIQLFPPTLIGEVINKYFGQYGTRIFQHSINSQRYCYLKRMSIWAAAIDLLCFRNDVLVIQSAGNLPRRTIGNQPGVQDHLAANRVYPDYLFKPSSRISNPAQSLQALSVGSISGDFFLSPGRQSISPTKHASAFSRAGFGLWDSIKPEVVEFGGDFAFDTGNPPRLTSPNDICPQLVRSTMAGGPPFAKEEVGTSFSAPKVAHIAGKLAALLPASGTLLYRGLIVNSARWPSWAEDLNPLEWANVVRKIGYGVPDLSRATENSNYRVTFITTEDQTLRAKECIVFGVPIPESMRRPGADFDVRVDVTLSYAAEPRRTRSSRRGYLGVWLDWRASKQDEPFDGFLARAIKEMETTKKHAGANLRWHLGAERQHGIADGVSRGKGTVQKDWAIVPGHELPEIFGVTVRGHKGWDNLNENATARFSLVVSFEILGSEVKIYEDVRAIVEAEVQVNEILA